MAGKFGKSGGILSIWLLFSNFREFCHNNWILSRNDYLPYLLVQYDIHHSFLQLIFKILHYQYSYYIAIIVHIMITYLILSAFNVWLLTGKNCRQSSQSRVASWVDYTFSYDAKLDSYINCTFSYKAKLDLYITSGCIYFSEKKTSLYLCFQILLLKYK